MNGWLRYLLVGALAVTSHVLSGCTQTQCVESGDWKRMYESAALPKELSSAPEPLLKNLPPPSPAPATVLDPDRPARYLSLELALAMALENGTIGLESVRVPGVA